MNRHSFPTKGKNLLLVAIFFLAGLSIQAQTTMGRQKVDQYPVTAWGTPTYGLTWLPTDYNNTTQNYPLIIFLHGSGEGGDGVWGLNNLLIYGLPNRIANGFNPEAVNPTNGQHTKFIVVSPQAPSAAHWSYAWGSIQWILADVMNRYRVDPSRIYVTGISAGGAGAWSCYTNGAAAAQKFAAIAPVSAAGTNSSQEGDQIPLIGGTYGGKVWNICGTNDSWMAFANNATNLINSNCSETAAIVTGIPGTGHDPGAWNTAYDPNWRSNGLNMYEWMLKYQRGGSTPAPVNQPPVALAGSSQTITLPLSTVNLNGSGSDADGSISSYAWSQVGGPTPAVISSPSSAATSVNGLLAGTYTFRLRVTDNNGASATSDVSVTVNPLQIIDPGTSSVTIQAENWSTMYGVQKENTQDAGGGQNVGGQDNGDWMEYSVNLSSAGTYNMSFRIATMVAGAQFQVRKSDGTVLATLNVPSTGSYQTWQTINASVTLPAGQQNIRIYTVVSPAGWNLNWFSLAATASAPNQPPTANAGNAQSIILPASAQLNGSGTDADGSVTSFAWTQVSGPSAANFSNANAASTTAGNLSAGSYVFRLTVRDNAGASATSDVTITVSAMPGGSNPAFNLKVEGESWAKMYGVQKETTQDAGGGQNVGGQDAGDWMDYSVNLPSSGTYALNFRIATMVSGAQFQLRKQDGTVLATVSVPSTGSYQSWQTISANVTLPAGQQLVRIYTAASPAGWNLNWLEFSTAGTTTPDPVEPVASTKIEAENWSTMSGVQKETTQDAGGGQNVGGQDMNDWMDYSINISATGSYTLKFRVATMVAGAKFVIKKSDGTILSTVDVPSTGAYQSWQTISTQVQLNAGQQTLRIQTIASPAGWNLNWFEFSQSASTITTRSVTEEQSATTASLEIFPSAVQQRFALKLVNGLKGKMQVDIMDMNGSVKKQFNLTKPAAGSTQTYLSISDLPKGEYILRVSMNGSVDTTKLIKL